METDNVTQKRDADEGTGEQQDEEEEEEEVEEREAARDNDTEEPGIMGWFTRRHKLRENQLARPTLTTRSCSELSSGEKLPAISSAVPEQIATLCFLSPRCR